MSGDSEAREAVGEYKAGWHDPENSTIRFDFGLSEEVVRQISELKEEPEWMTDIRVKAFKHFSERPMPTWGNTSMLEEIDFENICYYLKSSDSTERDWEDVPDDIRNTFERLGIPEAEQKWLSGVTAQYESEAVYHSIREDLEKQGVIFLDMDSGLKEYPEIVKKWFCSVVPYSDNKFSALNTAVWSGGSFIYVPEGVHVEMPVQAYFRINAKNMGQFERTLIIADKGSSIHYVEGCTAPSYSTDSLHSAVVELVALPGSHIRYSTIQNWSSNVYNLVTKRGIAHEDAKIEWVDGNIGSKLTMKYPAVILKGEGSHAEVISVAYSGEGQHQDAGAKIHHLASNTTSKILSKSISKNGGRGSYRGMVTVSPKADNCKLNVVCDALILDEGSRSDTYPTMEVANPSARCEHEASVSKVSDDQLFYLMSRGHSEEESLAMIVNGFFEPFTRELPMEYAVELNQLMALEMEGSIG
ncbi:MAG TPA: Fe-S cluster assembly protein SufB [Candidatus Poseidoniales archaeon]|nr:Fe-S cluster assembly protein SufB [Euryarchaeota archaeon]GIS03351.1 MAG: putative FeS assembly protein SufB [Euryarchaeota archaeon]DAC13473.1 MAG TPA: Fe-S cluster assembly protein SufB [Candidatus Poseidoniales archaeon]HIH66859.1 Fe-S cluster assembly protein SufB [Candidatus Thalassarchaeaceae archaeon]